MIMENIEITELEKTLSERGRAESFTSGGSMRPLLRENRDIAVIAKPAAPFRKNDVILYRRKGASKPILHRIIAIKDGKYVIRGDNTYKKERDITDKNILGVLVGVYRNGKYIDCEHSKGYKIYVFLMRACYPLRHLWFIFLRPLLSKIKRLILK